MLDIVCFLYWSYTNRIGVSEMTPLESTQHTRLESALSFSTDFD